MGKVILIIALVAIAIFLGPLLVLVGWNCARELWPELPAATYHHAFWITNGIATLVKSRAYTKGD